VAVPAFVITLGVFLLCTAVAEPGLWSDTQTTERIIDIGRNDNQVMKHLDHLCHKIGQRPAGSREHHETAEWAYEKFRQFGLSDVHLEQCGEVAVDPEDDWTDGLLQKITRMVSGDDDEAGKRMVPVYNVVGDIPGTETPDEYVIIGAHYDCVPIGTGALDNGTGTAAVMEAARILVEAGVRPRRTIRFVLFAGEESGLIGSRGFVEAHPDLLPKISAVYNMDHGTNYISGIPATEPLRADMEAIFAHAARLDATRPFEIEVVDYLPKVDPNCCQPGGDLVSAGPAGPVVLAQVYRQEADGSVKLVKSGFEDLGTLDAEGEPAKGDSTLKQVVVSGGCGGEAAKSLCGGEPVSLEDLKAMGLLPDGAEIEEGKRMLRAIGGSDHAPFLAAGVPGFWWGQGGDSTVLYPAHTADDTYDMVVPEYLEHSATVMAMGALGTANLDHMLSRERLLEPEGDDDEDGQQGAASPGESPAGTGSFALDKANAAGKEKANKPEATKAGSSCCPGSSPAGP
jgi:hypothetical protein